MARDAESVAQELRERGRLLREAADSIQRQGFYGYEEVLQLRQAAERLEKLADAIARRQVSVERARQTTAEIRKSAAKILFELLRRGLGL